MLMLLMFSLGRAVCTLVAGALLRQLRLRVGGGQFGCRGVVFGLGRLAKSSGVLVRRSRLRGRVISEARSSWDIEGVAPLGAAEPPVQFAALLAFGIWATLRVITAAGLGYVIPAGGGLASRKTASGAMHLFLLLDWTVLAPVHGAAVKTRPGRRVVTFPVLP